LSDSRKARGSKRTADTVIQNIVTRCRSLQASFKKDAEQNRNKPKQFASSHTPAHPTSPPCCAEWDAAPAERDAAGHRLPKIVRSADRQLDFVVEVCVVEANAFGGRYHAAPEALR
jgi:hypothetical protein